MTDFILYHYNPTLIGAIFFAVLFSATTIQHAVQLARYRAWFMLPVVIGGIFELTAYIARAVSHFFPPSLGPYIIQSLLTLVAPALFAAIVYMILGRIIRLLHAEHHSMVQVNQLTKLFVLFDVLIFQVQSAGAGLQAQKKPSAQHFGQILVLVALVLQIVVFAMFVIVAAVFQRRVVSQPTQQSQGPLRWKRHMNALYGISGLVLLRNIIRVVEYAQGYSGYINGHEWFLYTFDAVSMFGVMVVMGVIYAPVLLGYKGEELSEIAVELQPSSIEQADRA